MGHPSLESRAPHQEITVASPGLQARCFENVQPSVSEVKCAKNPAVSIVVISDFHSSIVSVEEVEAGPLLRANPPPARRR